MSFFQRDVEKRNRIFLHCPSNFSFTLQPCFFPGFSSSNIFFEQRKLNLYISGKIFFTQGKDFRMQKKVSNVKAFFPIEKIALEIHIFQKDFAKRYEMLILKVFPKEGNFGIKQFVSYYIRPLL